MKIKFNTDTYKSYIEAKHPNFIPLEPYTGISTNLQHYCKSCQNVWDTQPRTILRGAHCKFCFYKIQTKPIDQYHFDLQTKNPEMKLIGEYKNAYTKSMHKHVCGHEWMIRPESLLRGAGCPACFVQQPKGHWSEPFEMEGILFGSKFEADCAKILINTFGKNNISFQKLYSPVRRMTCDFYITSLDFYIEVSTINKIWYMERIWNKRKMVKNFFFASDTNQLEEFIKSLNSSDISIPSASFL